MAANDVHLKLRKFLGRYRDFRELSEACRDSVNDFVPPDDVVHDRSGAQHSLAGLRSETYANAVGGYSIGFIDGEGVAVDEKFLGHFFRFFGGVFFTTRFFVALVFFAGVLAARFFVVEGFVVVGRFFGAGRT
jgi:hypothetical protein